MSVITDPDIIYTIFLGNKKTMTPQSNVSFNYNFLTHGPTFQSLEGKRTKTWVLL